MSDGMTKVAVIGAGSWGTALAISALKAGCETVLWARSAEQAQEMAQRRENARYLPGVVLPDALAVSADPAVLSTAQMLLLVTPAQALRAILETLSRDLAPGVPVIICAKGLEQETHKMLDQVVSDILPDSPAGVLSGPSFAQDVAEGLPTAVTLAFKDLELAQRLGQQLSHRHFRIYSSNDLIGVQLGGAVKNVMAIACGICMGEGLGASTRAALLTRSFAELLRLAVALGAKPETLHGLSGLGDLFLTSTSSQSRNYSLGLELGRGRSLTETLAGRHTVSEGVYTAQVVSELANLHRIDMPICQAVAAVVQNRSNLDTEIDRLLSRPQRDELDAPIVKGD